MPDEDDDIDSMTFEELTQRIDAELAELKARSVDETASRADRLQAAEALLRFKAQTRRMMPGLAERLVRVAYGDLDSAGETSPEYRRMVTTLLIDHGFVTQTDLDRRPMDEVLMHVRQRLADRGFVDDTGLAG